MRSRRHGTWELYRLISTVRTPAEARQLLHDLLTPRELTEIAKRWQVVLELAAGTAQREIVKKVGVGMATVTRGSRALRFGKGGFQHFLKKLKKVR